MLTSHAKHGSKGCCWTMCNYTSWQGASQRFSAPPKKGNVPRLFPLPPAQNSTLHLPARAGALSGNTQPKGAAAYFVSFSPFAWPSLLCTNQAKKPARGPRTSKRSEEVWGEYPGAQRWSWHNKAKYHARGPRFELAPTKLRTPPGVPAYSSAARICGVGFGVACGLGFEAVFRPANGAGALSLFRPRSISREAKPATGRPARERAGEARSGRRRRRC